MQKMKHVLAVVSLVFAVGCSSVLVRPEADQVKSVAIVSVYMNRDIYDVEAPKASQGKSLGSLIKAAATTAARETFGDKQGEQMQPVVLYGVKRFAESLSADGKWSVVPPMEVVATDTYKSFYQSGHSGGLGEAVAAVAKMTVAEYAAPEGMLVVPISSLVEPSGTIQFGSGADQKEKARERLAELAKELNVDAVAVVEIDAGYEKGWFTINGVQRAAGSVAAKAVLVTKDGKIALRNVHSAPGGGKRFTGDTLRMVRVDDGVVLFENPEVVNSFNEAIDAAAADLNKRIVTELAEVPAS